MKLGKITQTPSLAKHGTARSKIVAAWPQLHGMTAKEMAAHIGTISVESVRITLQWMRESGRAHSKQVGKDHRWYDGENPEKPAPVPTVARPDRIDRMAGEYTCPELRSQPYRAGSQDAYRIASRGFA